MDEAWINGTWLLMDAAGPESVVGILKGGKWLEKERHAGDFLEWHQQAVERLLKATGLELSDLTGVLYAKGPVSTLGLRLAAMFIRTITLHPDLSHWQVLEFNNLELALAGESENGHSQLVAPWKKERLHVSSIKGKGRKACFTSASIEASEAGNSKGVVLGRGRGISPSIDWIPYPIERIPGILASHPGLLHPNPEPAPHAVEDPQFAQWHSRRHSAP